MNNIFSWLFFVFCSLSLHAQEMIDQPNFLFILVDDQPHDALGITGRYPFLKTPNIDRLAKEGVNVKNFL